MSTSRENSFHACLDEFITLTATGFPSGRIPLYTRLQPPFPIRFSVKKNQIHEPWTKDILKLRRAGPRKQM